MNSTSNGIGLVLCGGGAKGAFQIGAWKALEKAGLINKITAVSGTSVGALNAVLFALGDYDLAKNIWLRIDKTVLLNRNESGGSFFSRDGLIEILNSLPLEALKGKIPVYVTAYNCGRERTEHFCINDLPVEDMKTLLLASSAMPVAYERNNFKGFSYKDGGISDLGNTPVTPLYKKGYKNIFIIACKEDFSQYKINANPVPVSLSPDENKIERVQHNFIDIEQYYPNAKYMVIKPTDEMGGTFKGTLNFNHDYVIDKVAAGYKAAVFTLKAYGIMKEDNIMKKDCAGINVLIEAKVKALFRSAEEFEHFINLSNAGETNIDFPTMGGHTWWTPIAECYGWKVQQHNLGNKKHYRILDNNDIRRAWFTDPNDLLNALTNYEALKETGLA